MRVLSLRESLRLMLRELLLLLNARFVVLVRLVRERRGPDGSDATDAVHQRVVPGWRSTVGRAQVGLRCEPSVQLGWGAVV